MEKLLKIKHYLIIYMLKCQGSYVLMSATYSEIYQQQKRWINGR